MLWWKRKCRWKNFDATLKPRGQDITDAFREWAKTEITRAVDASYQLGRFLFSVSAATAGGLITLATFAKIDPGWFFLLSIIFLAASAAVAINLAIPNHWDMDGNTNLYEVHWNMVSAARITSLIWILLWSLGVLTAIAWAV